MPSNVVEIGNRRERDRFDANVRSDGADVIVEVSNLELAMTPRSARLLVRGIIRELRALERAAGGTR